MRNAATIALSLAVLSFSACKDNQPEGPSAEDFDKEAMLRNIAEEVIVPSYEALATSLESLRLASEAYQADPTTSNLELLRERLDEAYVSWQGCAPFEIGPAANEGLKLLVNTFPSDTSRVVSLIEMY